jgi:phosphodiesterase/alkaline phosphatase D-like protein
MLQKLTSLLAALILITIVASPVSAAGIAAGSGPAPLDYQEGDVISVGTQGATNVTQTSATLVGYLESLGPYPTVQVWFELSDGQTTGRQTMSNPGTFSARVSGLAPGTDYDFHAVAMSTLMGGQTAEGNYVPFRTTPSMPQAPIQVATSSASEVTSGTAVLQGYLSGMGPYNSVTVWFNWGNSPNFTNETGHQALYRPGPFSIQVSGLSPNTTYYFRAAAQPEVVGVTAVYGSTGSFNTSGGGVLSVSTGAISAVGTTSASIVGYLESLGSYRNAYVWFEWGPTGAYGQTTPLQTLYAPGTFSFTLQGLNPGTSYHFRALAVPTVAGGATVRGLDSIFTTTFAPGIQATTNTAGNISATSATFNGYLTSAGVGAGVDVWFEWGTNSTLGASTPRQTMTNPGSFSFNLGGLQPGATYYYRAAAYSNGAQVYGAYSNFRTTSSSPISISTNSASSISTTGATLNAYVNSLGTLRSVQVSFNWGSSPSYGNTTAGQNVSYPGAVSLEVNGLAPGADYYFQAIARAPDGSIIYGEQSVFTTISSSGIAVATSPATAISTSTAVLNGVLNRAGNASSIQVWFEYGTTAEFGNSTSPMLMSTQGNFSAPVEGLAPGRAYYYRSVALNMAPGSRSVYGPITSFTTAGGPAPAPPSPQPAVPAFVWLIGGGMLMVIIILIILLGSRR